MKAYWSSVDYGKDEISFRVKYENRKTLEIAVHPDARVVVKAPRGTKPEAVENRIRKRVRWIRKQINYFRKFEPRTPARRYVGGETHLYLGRQYRLKIKKQKEPAVKLKGAYLHIMTPDVHDSKIVKRVVNAWYKEHARLIYARRLEKCYKTAKSLQVAYPEIQLRKMVKRWGSCTRSGNILLNTKLLRAPLYCIDYVIMHELCHLKEHTHNNGYYKLLSKYMPDWEKRKERLEKMLF